MLLTMFVGQVWAHDKVVVIPLMGSTGDAQAGDVLRGKTFSNADRKGITGTRPQVPVAKTGMKRSDYVYDDYSNALFHGEYYSGTRFYQAMPDFSVSSVQNRHDTRHNNLK